MVDCWVVGCSIWRDATLCVVRGDKAVVWPRERPVHSIEPGRSTPPTYLLTNPHRRCEIGSKVYYLAYLSVANGGSDKYEW